jgi:dolichyl-phosphate-mannose--protein O-mannosyl transferase
LTRLALNSQEINYTTGSQSQEVACHHIRNPNDIWIIDLEIPQTNVPFANDDIVTLKHKETGCYLYSEQGVPTPVFPGQQEISCRPEDGTGNHLWRLETHGHAQLIGENRFKLIHVNSNHALHSHPEFLTTGSGYQEVTGFGPRDDNDFWNIQAIHTREILYPGYNPDILTVFDGDEITAFHKMTGFSLHSSPINYTTGSQSQEVTANFQRNANDIWDIQHQVPFPGHPFQENDIVTLRHKATGCYLYSEQGVPTPVFPGQQEISCRPEDGTGNHLWRLENHGQHLLEAGRDFKLIHVNSNHALHSHDTYLTTGSRLQEVTGFGPRDINDFFNIKAIHTRSIELPEFQSTMNVVMDGDVLTLIHENSNNALYSSSNYFYTAGSLGQEVTCSTQRDTNNYFRINQVNPSADGMIHQDDEVTLTHVNTGKYLYSEDGILSHATAHLNQQEVRADNLEDGNQLWRVEVHSRIPWLMVGFRFVLIHVATDKTLHSHPETLPSPMSGQQEVTCFQHRDGNDHWKVEAIHP